MMDPNAKTRFSEAVPDPFVGRTFDGYRIEGIIGRGGMGTVYKAMQLSLGRPVAIKVLSSDLSEQAQFLNRFHREADTLAKLSHPNVVAVYDRGEIDGQPYLAMEYVEGTSLRDIVNKGPLATQEALRIVSSVLEALQCAHENGIVHRDIKPENVLLARNRVVKVADFGLSRLLGPIDQTRLTRTQLVLGTYEYMAPEQRERSREADTRADLYATGVVLYEMLTGELPIGRFQMPSETNPEECDRRVDQLIERSLEKSPDRRYQEAQEMGRAVSAILERPDVERSAPPDVPPPERARPHPGYSAPTPKAFRPARFEYHIDNVATIDHVLGTICYVIGFMALFGAGFTRVVWAGIPFFVFFVAGWYLRNTSENLGKYRPSARTGQAVIAILAGFTGILFPFSIYSLWALFSHRGRTYYDARGRGLDEQQAARHTYRMLEDPFGPPRPAPAHRPAARRQPVPPRPSAIPVQSVVTSEVGPSPRPRKLSGLIKAGIVCLALATVSLVAAAAAGFDPDVAGVLTICAGGFLLLGFLHALMSRRVRGAGLAFVLLLLFGMLALAAMYWVSAEAVSMSAGSSAPDDSPVAGAFELAPLPPGETYPTPSAARD